jgi:hypothetical protein
MRKMKNVIIRVGEAFHGTLGLQGGQLLSRRQLHQA